MNRILAIVVTYNRLDLLKECIDALSNQTFKAFDILVINNASTDGTDEYLQTEKEKGILDFITKENNTGGAGGFNAGIKEALKRKYDFFWLMDDDTITKSNTLEELWNAAKGLKENFGFLTSYALWKDGTHCKINKVKLKGKDYYEDSFHNNKGIHKAKSATFVSLLINAEAAKEVGLPIKEFFIWSDDQEYTLRIQEKYDSYIVTHSEVVHKTANNLGSNIILDDYRRIARYKIAFRNEWYIARKWKERNHQIAKIKQVCEGVIRFSDHKAKRIWAILSGTVKGFFFRPKIEEFDNSQFVAKKEENTKANEQQPSIKKNFFYNTGYKILTYIIPLITAPYTARIFGADGTGIQSFTGSISAYFVLFATLGTVSYGMREIAMCRDDKKKRSKTFWEIELLSIATTSVCLVAWIVLIIFSEKYTPYYMVLTMNIIGVAFDVSWFFSGLENYKLIVIRNTIFRLIGVAILFLVVREKSDLLLYWALTAASGLLGNISLWFALPKYLVKVPFKNMHFTKHLRETMVYFVPTIATTVYTVLDKTMIGVITKDTKENGYYEQTNKLVTMALSLIMSFNIVMNTRMSYLFANNKIKEMKERLTKSIDFALWLAVPMTAGFIGIAERFVPFFYGSGYDKVITLLYVYSPLIIIIAISNCLAEQFLIPTGKIRTNSIAVIIGAVVNLCCNAFLIPCFKSIGAAIASIIAETVITCIIVYYSRTMMVWKTILKKMWKRIIAAIPMVIVVSIIGRVNISAVFVVSMQIIVGIGIYFLTLIILKDNSTKEYFNYYINKVKKRVKRS